MKKTKRKYPEAEGSEERVDVAEAKKRKKKKEVNTDVMDTAAIAESCVIEKLDAKHKKETKTKDPKAPEAIAAVRRNKKVNKKNGYVVGDTDTGDVAEGSIKEKLNVKKSEKPIETKMKGLFDLQESEAVAEKNRSEECVDVAEAKKKKVQVKAADAPIVTESREPNRTKNEKQSEGQDGQEEEEEVELELELSPEERRVLERKLKKILKKEEKKMLKLEGKDKVEEEGSKSSAPQKQALAYLTCWSKKRDEWKFQKTRQVWLLQHMYDREKVTDTHFSLLLEYIDGLQGVARETTVRKAEALVRFGTGQEGEEGAIEAQTRTNRAREVVQLLS